MLIDCHAIWGYLLGKYFYSLDHTTKNNIIQNIVGSMDKQTTEMKLKKFAKLFNNINERKSTLIISENKFLVWGAILSCLPDIDVILSPFFGGHHSFHRTATHSLFGNLFIVPVATVFTKYMLKMSWKRSLVMTSSGVFGHIFFDFITNYGTSFLWPLVKNSYTLGIITVWDLTAIFVHYLFLTTSRLNLISPGKNILLFLTTIVVYIIWKRVNLQKAHKYFLTKNNKFGVDIANYSTISLDVYDWIHPLSRWPTLYKLLAYDKKKNQVSIVDEIDTNKIPPKVTPTLNNLVIDTNTSVGFKRISNRDGFQSLIKGKSGGVGRRLLYDIFPSILFISAYHIYFIRKFINEKKMTH